MQLLDNSNVKNDNLRMESSTFNEIVGTNLRDLRKAKGLTQEDFAARSGFSRGTIANIETGRQTASGHQVFHLGSVLGLSTMDDIFPTLLTEDDGEDTEVPIHGERDFSDTQLAQIQELARRVR